MSNDLDIEQMMKLIKMKQERPEEYKELLEGIVGVAKDLQEAMMESLK